VTDRRVSLAGPVNFRDLGGYAGADGCAVQWRRLYRSDSLHHLEPDDGPLLRELGLMTAIDFRADDELDSTGDLLANEHTLDRVGGPYRARCDLHELVEGGDAQVAYTDLQKFGWGRA
jgi:hypothetical protein